MRCELVNGILPLWKERGMTSHDCVFKLRKILHTKKIGHGGTLDPDVDGVLPICIGKGTKVIEFLTDSGKRYEGEITLGFATTTEDASGEIIEQTPVTRPLSVEEIDQAMQKMEGPIIQIPPMYSAVKVNGKRLYEYARNNETVKRPERKVTIYQFKRISDVKYDEEKKIISWRFSVVCSKGTYVRTLAVDTGKALGYAAHMSDLTRMASGGFSKEQAYTLSQVAQFYDQNRFSEILLPIEYGVKDFPRIDVDLSLAKKICNGMRLTFQQLGFKQQPDRPLALFYNNQVLSIYEPHETDSTLLKPKKVLQTNLKEDEHGNH